MTKKDFNALTKAIKETQAVLLPFNHERLANTIADICAESNPRFNREAFLIACGIPAWALTKEPTA